MARTDQRAAADTRFAPIRSLLEEGLSWRQIALRLGVTKNTVAGRIYRAGFCAPKTGAPSGPLMSEIVAQIDFRGCNHIRGNPRDIRPGMYCGKPVARHGLCADHAALCWITPPAPAARPAPAAQ